MRILHTADWHLADRLKQIDRTADLERAVERIAEYCDQHAVDVLAIAGDLFSELARPEALQASLAHLSRTFRPFLMRSGTVVAVAGNHDNDIYCETLRRAFQLAAPSLARPGDTLPTGRLYLATRPVHFRLRDSLGATVQFACMPYPTTGRYLQGPSASSYCDFNERRTLLREAFINQLNALQRQIDARQPSMLLAHINALPHRPSLLFPHPLDDDILIDASMLTNPWTYVALGHLHGYGKVRGSDHIRYSGSIERLSIAEKDQPKGVVLVDLETAVNKLRARLLPLPATTFYDVRIDDPRRQLPLLGNQYPDAATALVRCHLSIDPREDNLQEVLAEISRIFPRCYERSWSERYRSAGPSASPPTAPPHANDDASATAASQPFAQRPFAEAPPDSPALLHSASSVRQLVIRYVTTQLAHDRDRETILQLVEQLLEQNS